MSEWVGSTALCLSGLTGIHCTHRQQTQNWPLFYDVQHAKCTSYAVQIKDMSKKFISNKWETAITSKGHMTTAALKQAHKEDNRELVFIRL